MWLKEIKHIQTYEWQMIDTIYQVLLILIIVPP
jgi:hypothetical protein